MVAAMRRGILQASLWETRTLPRALLCREPGRTLGKDPLLTAKLSAKPSTRQMPALLKAWLLAKEGSWQR